ncbi:hypothetical protein PHLGIDRAFT_20321 [Phlebiopsis gigantea 11061_1 CR5-6]|uniref:Uncharacterized protein n=1 Tax=Phlebiopsis gigantea (strain 11061_1 CR5-6) TaxID=745531 RepID=A0A0C3S1C8_PHLG1|nr:hypothetical protein PHLGIDRAFT_20321 [Phlebiopsis gigantea 11061_1 CR5-6]
MHRTDRPRPVASTKSCSKGTCGKNNFARYVAPTSKYQHSDRDHPVPSYHALRIVAT